MCRYLQLFNVCMRLFIYSFIYLSIYLFESIYTEVLVWIILFLDALRRPRYNWLRKFS